mgnify:CR=1 FL=1
MKKTYLLLFLPLLAFSLSACSHNTSAPTDSQDQETPAEVENQAAAPIVTDNLDQTPAETANQTPVASTENPQAAPLTLTEVAKHASPADCWMAIDGQVYDMTPYVASGKHPGGEKILNGCGKDASLMFQMVGKHQENNAARLLPEYTLGALIQ